MGKGLEQRGGRNERGHPAPHAGGTLPELILHKTSDFCPFLCSGALKGKPSEQELLELVSFIKGKSFIPHPPSSFVPIMDTPVWGHAACHINHLNNFSLFSITLMFGLLVGQNKYCEGVPLVCGWWWQLFSLFSKNFGKAINQLMEKIICRFFQDETKNYQLVILNLTELNLKTFL